GDPEQERRSRRRGARRAVGARASAGGRARIAEDLRRRARRRAPGARRALGLSTGERRSRAGLAAAGAGRPYRGGARRTRIFQTRDRRARPGRSDMTRDSKTPQDWWSTAIIDMQPGKIRYRGYAVEELIGRVGFASMVYLLTRGELPDPQAARLLEAALVAAVDPAPRAPSLAAARMAVTCGVGINTAMASAVNMLGDVHGGAGEQCVRFYSAVAARMDGGVPLAQAVTAE